MPSVVGRLGKPRLHYLGSVLGLPFFQLPVVATFSFDDLAAVRIFVLLYLPSTTG